MAKRSAGLLVYKRAGDEVSVLLVHPGGPFWKDRDEGAWSIPKGEYGEGEEPLLCAIRECEEELGLRFEGEFVALGEAKQRSGKIVSAWAVEGEFDPGELRSNSFEIEWPPRSGKRQSFPEVDRAQWFAPEEARRKILPGQAVFVDRLLSIIRLRVPPHNDGFR
jgi:predicted NUDIX family NTP pyrophosphohydrolase